MNKYICLLATLTVLALQGASAADPTPTEAFISNSDSLRLRILGGLSSVRTPAKRNVLTDAVIQLQLAENSGKILQSYVGQVQSRFDTSTQQQNRSLTSVFSTWANIAETNIRILGRSNQSLVNSSVATVDELHNRYESYLADCNADTETLLSSYQDSVNTAFQQYGTTVNTLQDAAAGCLSSNVTIADSISCTNGIRSPLNQMRNAPGSFTQLVQQGAAAINNAFGGTSCYSQTLQNFNSEKNSVWNSIYRSLINASG